MKYKLLAYSSVESDLAAIAQPYRKQVREAINSLPANPRPTGAVRLSGYADVYRIRVGDYRVAYRLRDRELEIIIAAAAKRGEIYRHLKRRMGK